MKGRYTLTPAVALLLATSALLHPVQAQSLTNPAALNVVNLCPYNPGNAYTKVYDVWGINTGGKHYALATLSKDVGNPESDAGLAVIDATNPASPFEVLFISLKGAPSWVNNHPKKDSLELEYSNDARDVETYVDQYGGLYAYIARMHGGIQVIDLSTALTYKDSSSVTLEIDGYGSNVYGKLIPRLDHLWNDYPAGYSNPSGRSAETHTLFVGGDYLYVSSQTDLVDVWSLKPEAMRPRKVGTVRLSVGYDDQDISGKTRNRGVLPDHPTEKSQYMGVHELYAEAKTATTARLFVAYTRGGLQVIDNVNLTGGTSPTDTLNNDLTPPATSVKKMVYDIDRKYPAEEDALSPFDFRNTHSAWPIKGGDYVVTTDEFTASFDRYAPSLKSGDLAILEGEKAHQRSGHFLRIWDTDMLGTSSALQAGYDIPESAMSQGITSLSAIDTSSVPNNTHQVFARGDLLYVAGYTQGLRVLDVSNPQAPVEVGYYDPYPMLSIGNYQSNIVNGAYGVFPDPDRPGIVYVGSNLESGTVGSLGVYFLRYFIDAIDHNIPHDVTLSGTFSMPQTVYVRPGAELIVAENTTLNVAASTYL